MNLKKSTKNLLLDFLFDLIGSICYAIGIYTFARAADFAPGGVSGLALIINYLWKKSSQRNCRRKSVYLSRTSNDLRTWNGSI